MTKAFTRRGFTCTALLGSAGLWLPHQVAAQDSPSVDSRLVAASRGNVFELRLTNREERGLEVLAAALRLQGTIRSGDTSLPVIFASDARRLGSRSRAGFRLGRRILLPPGEETVYDTYRAQWATAAMRSHAGQRATLVVRTALEADVSGDRSDDVPELRGTPSVSDRAVLGSLTGIRLRTAVILPR